MSEPERYVAYYRMPAIGMAPSGGALTGQRQAVSAFLELPNRVLVGEFTEVMAPSVEGEIPPAFQLAVDCCLTLGAALVASLAEPGLGSVENDLVRDRGVALCLLEAPGETGDGADAGPITPESTGVPYLNLKSSRRPPLPFRERTAAGNRAKADQFAQAILPIIQQIRDSGAITLTEIARELNARQVRTARGRRWYPMTVRNILQRNGDL